MPSTRYQGSKLKLLPWIAETIQPLEFSTAIDLFGGAGCVAYLLKTQGKRVVYNDHLRFNQLIAKAIIENDQATLPDATVEELFRRQSNATYDDFIARTFSDIYFTAEENQWLDTVCQNIRLLACEYEQAIAYYALFQACMVKRPYNLFHRKNLYMRTASVARGFGNKTTWDTPFETHFKRFVAEANAAVFDSGECCQAICNDALAAPRGFDLAYIDTPYLNGKGTGVDYFAFYHFLEGLVDYSNWKDRVNHSRKHRPLHGERSAWSDAATTHAAFAQLFERYSDSTLVVSYRSDGVPSEEELIQLLRRHKSSVERFHYGSYKYALSKNRKSKEILLVAQ